MPTAQRRQPRAQGAAQRAERGRSPPRSRAARTRRANNRTERPATAQRTPPKTKGATHNLRRGTAKHTTTRRGGKGAREGGRSKRQRGTAGGGSGGNHPERATKHPTKKARKTEWCPPRPPPAANTGAPTQRANARKQERTSGRNQPRSERKDARAPPSEQTTRRREPLRIWDACKRQFCAGSAQKKRLLCPAACGKIDMVGFCAAAPAGLANPPPVSTIGERRAARLRTRADSRIIDKYSGFLQ